MTQLIPLFKSHYSLLRSILTVDPYDSSRDKDLPDSIIDIAVENNLKEVVLVEDSMAGYIAALQSCEASNIKLIFGLRMTFVRDSSEKSDDSLISCHKNIIFPKNLKGYKTLIKLSTLASYDNFYKEPRLSYSDLHNYWSDDLEIAVPFYDSFIHNNLLKENMCVPEFSRNIPHTVFIESNGIVFDNLLRNAALEYAKAYKKEVLETKSIYYKNREDYDAFLALKCLNRKKFGSGRTLDNPGFDDMSSREFSWESYLEAKDRLI